MSPKKSLSTNPREHHAIMVRFHSEKEKELVEAAAQAQSRSASNFLRYVILTHLHVLDSNGISEHKD